MNDGGAPFDGLKLTVIAFLAILVLVIAVIVLAVVNHAGPSDDNLIDAAPCPTAATFDGCR